MTDDAFEQPDRHHPSSATQPPDKHAHDRRQVRSTDSPSRSVRERRAERQAATTAVYAPTATKSLTALLPALRVLIGLWIAALVIAALYFGRDILIPLALAVLVGFLLDPAVTRLKRWGLPRMVGTLMVVAVLLAALGGMGAYLGNQVSELSADLPTYQNTIRKKLRNLRSMVKGPSMWDGAIKTYSTVEKEITDTTAKSAQVQKVEMLPPQSKPWEQVTVWIDKVSAPIAMAGIVLLFVILILLDRDGLRDRLLRLMGGNLHVATDALDEASERIGKYLRMQFIVNVTYGVPMALGLWFLGVPGAVLWGVLATVMRFVPYVGPMISAVFPLALAFAVAPGWDMFLWTLGLILLLELISNNVIEPWLYGSSTGLSTLSIILAATFWTALWGPIGLILSTPLTVCLLVLGRYIPALNFFEVMLGSEPVLDLPQRLYQRLLADDVDEAVDLANDTIDAELDGAKEAQDIAAAVVHFYDEGGVPMLKLASNHYADVATAEHRLRLSSGMAELMDEMREEYLVPAPRVAARVHCVGARWDMDAQAAEMAAHALALHGFAATFAEHPLSTGGEHKEAGDWAQVDWLVLSIFHPQPQAQARLVQRRMRRYWPHVKVVLAMWNAPAELLAEGMAQRLGAQAVVTSMQELVLRMQTLAAAVHTEGGYVPAQLPDNEAERLAALRASGWLQAPLTDLFHETAQKAANAFDVKFAQVSLVDEDWVHTPGGLLAAADEPQEEAGLPRNHSICAYVVHSEEDLVVEDVARDPRFSENPALAQARVRFYAGAPIKDAKGHVLGSLCIMHDEPREISDEELELLHEMASELTDEVRTRLKDKAFSQSIPGEALGHAPPAPLPGSDGTLPKA